MQRKHNKPVLLFITIFIISLCIGLSITGAYVYNKSSMEYAKMEQIVLVNANKVNNVITKLLYKTQILAALVVQNDGDINEFEKVATIILDEPAVRNVLIAPDGIVSNVYPLEGNEEAIGLNFFEPGAGNKEAIQARISGQLVLGGPFDLVQGGQALVGRLPVYLKDSLGNEKFWGLVSVTLNYPQALDGAELDQLQNEGFAFEIWRVSPDTMKKQIIAFSDYYYSPNARYVEKNIQILNANWQFRISPVRNWIEYPETWILGIGSLLVSCLVGFFAINTYNLKTMKNELEILTYTDPLTGVLNRRGLFSALGDVLKNGNCILTLCYMDLNKFKFINDKFGHGIGDKILQRFSEAFTKYTNENHIFARMGGDEFILIFKDTDNEEEISTFLNKVKNELENTLVDDCIKEIPIAFSIGKAVYPTQCQTIDDLLSCADSNMYKNKLMSE